MTPADQPGTEPTGVVMELARDDVERKKFLRMAGRSLGSAAAASGLAAFIAACGSSAPKSTKPAKTTATTTSPSSSASATAGDLQIVNYALTLEYLESQFYAKVAASGLFKGSTLATLKSFGAEEDAHVVALHKVASQLGTPVAKPKTKFPLTSATAVATLAATVENVGAAAYLGQAPRWRSTRSRLGTRRP